METFHNKEPFISSSILVPTNKFKIAHRSSTGFLNESSRFTVSELTLEQIKKKLVSSLPDDRNTINATVSVYQIHDKETITNFRDREAVTDKHEVLVYHGTVVMSEEEVQAVRSGDSQNPYGYEPELMKLYWAYTAKEKRGFIATAPLANDATARVVSYLGNLDDDDRHSHSRVAPIIFQSAMMYHVDKGLVLAKGASDD